MRNNGIEGFGNVGRVVLVKQGLFKGRKIAYPIASGGSLYKSHVPGKLFRTLKRLINTLAMGEAIHAAFYKTPEQIRLEAIHQEILRQEDRLQEVSC
jgi:hypothetical protein